MPATATDSATTNPKHTTPAGPIEHGFAPMPNELPFSRFGVLLPVMMLAMIPSLLLLYVAKAIDSYELFVGTEILTLILIFGSSAILVISGILGAIEYSQSRRSTKL